MPHRVALFVTCLVDFFRPSVGFASVKLLEDAGCTVEVPPTQTCCGQPAYNNGDHDDAQAIAKQVIQTFEGYDYVVVPSGSCRAMIKVHYPRLFQDRPYWQERAEALAAKTFELTSFLVDILKIDALAAQFDQRVTYHDSCSGLRELGIQEQPRSLLAKIDGLRLDEMRESQTCCGFGGTFCIKYPEISNRLVTDKVENAWSTRAEVLLGGDLGCLLNIAGRLSRLERPIRVFHVAEILAGMADGPAIGEARD